MQRLLRLPSRTGLMIDFQLGATLRAGSNHPITIPYEEEEVATYPVVAVEQFCGSQPPRRVGGSCLGVICFPRFHSGEMW